MLPDRLTPIEIVACAPDRADALRMMAQLSSRLAALTGSDGRVNFSIDAAAPGSVFLLALQDGVAVGCGALRPAPGASPGVGEIKRMYASEPGQGVGSALLAALEARAREFGYQWLWLETRAVNVAAVTFYQRHGYVLRENYGPYGGRPEAVCFEKRLGADS